MKIIKLFVAFTLICFALPRGAHAVVPAPDGGYPNGNTAEGDHALFSLGIGVFNTAVGWYSQWAVTFGSYNTSVGAGALDLNTGVRNTAIGAAALLLNTDGSDNTATGISALVNNDIGSGNTANGAFALTSNTSGPTNTADGFETLYSNTTGFGNTAVGSSALLNNTTGNDNTAIGVDALILNTTGQNNVALGVNAGESVTTASNVICIGAQLNGANVSNTCFIGNIRGVTTTNADAIPVLIDSAGQLGTMSSSRRFKKEIKSMDKASEVILGLKPVTFHYKNDNTDTPQFGLIAEEVANVNPDLVVHDKDGEIYSVRYEAVNAMLLNEFLKEHKTVREQGATITALRANDAKQEATIAQQQKEIDALSAGLQKVSAQLELSKPAPQSVLNNQ